MKNLSIIGSTGSIGRQTLDVVRNLKNDFKVVAMSAGRNLPLFIEQVREFKPSLVSLEDEALAEELKKRLIGDDIRVVYGPEGLREVAAFAAADVTLTAVVGMVGVLPTIAAIEAGKDVCLANKETLVTAGHIIMPLAREKNVKILPVDSEHSAIFQCIQGERPGSIKKLILTASGGPFRGKKLSDLEEVTAEMALNHPNWSMGRKISVDSATMINKGLEVIEAGWLFGMNVDDIEVVVHPQSIVHSMVEFTDGAIKAQLGVPDMRIPIQYALTYPDRRESESERLSLSDYTRLEFEKPDTETFKGLAMAYEAAKKGGNMPCIYNAANEVAVAAFLDEKIKFLEIYDMVSYAMKHAAFKENPDICEILDTEEEVREILNSGDLKK